MSIENPNPPDIALDRNNLYLEEAFTDLKAGTLKRLTPVTPEGAPDKGRKTLFVGLTYLVFPTGQLPIQAMIPAKDLQQAIKRFPEAMQSAMETLIAEAEKMKAKDDSRIIVPGR